MTILTREQIKRMRDLTATGWQPTDDLLETARAYHDAQAEVERLRAERETWGAATGRECYRADRAEAAIARVEALCDEADADLNSKHVCGPDCYCGCIYTDKVRAALDGEA